jgi:hypothetical protein
MEWLLWVGGGSVVMLLILLLMPQLLPRRRGPHNIKDAVNNARQIGLALFDFECKYGKFPDSSTVAAVRRDTGTTLTLPDRTSNDLFAQLLASGIAGSEHLFYANAISMRKPDNVFASDATILEHGECAFVYIHGLSTASDANTPVAFGPVIPGTATLDRKSCEGRAAILRVDNSVTTYPINPAGKIIINGLDLLDPRQPFWHGKAPDVKWPK